nr:hypothetical protein [Tanacetum cinerariifolium]
MQVTLHDKRIVMQVMLHYEAIVMQVMLRIVMQVMLHYEAIVMQVMFHDKRIVMQVMLHYEVIVMQVMLHYEAILMQVTLHDKRIVMQVMLHYEAIVMQVMFHDKRIVMQVMLHYEVIVMQVMLHYEAILMQVTLHDKRIVMQVTLHYEKYLDLNVAKLIIELCLFFKQICAQTLMKNDMAKAESQLIGILCNLEQIYPPAFFDIMIHLVIHLPEDDLEGVGGCKDNIGGRGGDKDGGSKGVWKETRNLRLKKCMDEYCSLKIGFEYNNKGTMFHVGQNSTRWSNLVVELARDFPMYYLSWHSIKKSKRAHIMGRLMGSCSLAVIRDQQDEARIQYEEMLRLRDSGANTLSGVPYTKEEILALVRKGK